MGGEVREEGGGEERKGRREDGRGKRGEEKGGGEREEGEEGKEGGGKEGKGKIGRGREGKGWRREKEGGGGGAEYTTYRQECDVTVCTTSMKVMGDECRFLQCVQFLVLPPSIVDVNDRENPVQS